MEEENQVDGTINPSEELDLDIQDNDEDVEVLRARLAEAEEAKRQLTARARKAEAEAKAIKQKPAEAPQNINNPTLSADEVDIKILTAQGVDADSIEYLKKVARVNGTSILAAQADELYVAFTEKREKERKQQEASLGASRGSAQSRKQKDFSTPGLSDEEHKELWKRKVGG